MWFGDYTSIYSQDSIPETTPTTLYVNQLSIKHHDREKIVFDENLKLVDADGNIIDEVTVSVEEGEEGEDSLDIYQHCRKGDFILRSQSTVLPEVLETTSEVRKIQEADITKFMRITSHYDSYRIFKVVNNIKEKSGYRDYWELSKFDVVPLILEGANILLLRKFAIGKFSGQLNANTINHDGNICEVEYTVEKINDGEIEVTRKVCRETMTTLLTIEGKIIEHVWSTSDLRLVSDIPRYLSKEWFLGLRGPVGEGSDLEASTAEEPMAHIPSYWQKKEEVLNLLKQYLIDHSDVQDMIADFMKNVLFDKPDDPIDYADKFFSEFVGIKWDSEEEDSVTSKSSAEKKTSA